MRVIEYEVFFKVKTLKAVQRFGGTINKATEIFQKFDKIDPKVLLIKHRGKIVSDNRKRTEVIWEF